MSARTSVVVLLVAVLACEPSAVPLQPVDDPLDGITQVLVEGPSEAVRAGSFVDVRVLNGSDARVTAAHACWQLEVERLDADTWTTLDNGIFGCAARAPLSIPARSIYEESLRLPEAGAPGQYRVTFPHFAAGSDELTVAASNAFTVQPTGVSEAK